MYITRLLDNIHVHVHACICTPTSTGKLQNGAARARALVAHSTRSGTIPSIVNAAAFGFLQFPDQVLQVLAAHAMPRPRTAPVQDGAGVHGSDGIGMDPAA